MPEFWSLLGNLGVIIFNCVLSNKLISPVKLNKNVKMDTDRFGVNVMSSYVLLEGNRVSVWLASSYHERWTKPLAGIDPKSE